VADPIQTVAFIRIHGAGVFGKKTDNDLTMRTGSVIANRSRLDSAKTHSLPKAA